MTDFADKYGPWAVVAGASVGIGAEFCRRVAAEGVNVVLVSRRADRLELLAKELHAEHGVDTRVAAIDLSVTGAEADMFGATDGIEVGLFVYNAGADTINTYFLDAPAEDWLAMVRRNCSLPLLASHHYGGEMVARKRGGILLVTSGAAWAGGGRITTYGGTKAFDLVFAEGLWAELRGDGIDVLALVVGATDTPSLRGSREVRRDRRRPSRHGRHRGSGRRRARASCTSLTGQRGRSASPTVPGRRCSGHYRAGRQSSSLPRVTTRCSVIEGRATRQARGRCAAP